MRETAEKRIERIEQALLAIYEMIWPHLPRKVQKEAEQRLVPLMREMRESANGN